MTPAVQDRPHTALDLLLGPGQEAPEALARQILSASAGVNLGRALENLPKATREAAVREVTTAAAGLLDVDLIGVLVDGWRKHQDLTAAARRTLAAPGSIELVDLATHGTDVVTSRAHLDLPGVIPLSPGIRLLAAHNYPADAGQAEDPDDDPTRHTARGPGP